MKKIAIVGIINNPATSLNSHSSGMVNIVSSLYGDADILTEKDNWNNYESIIIYHGVNYKKGTFNMIGGINDEVLKRCDLLSNFSGEILSLDGFQLNEFSIKRKLNLYDNYKTLEETKLPESNKLIIGDSHSISVWPDNQYGIKRMDGKTLYGFLKEPEDADYYYFGNIDVRFHLPRQVDPVNSTIELVKDYINLAKRNNAKVSCLLPIESESRKIPSTGLYKKKPFYGSQELRTELVKVFNTELLSSGLEVNVWPNEWYTNLEFYEKEVMEPKQSVHIRPKYYAKNLLNQLALF
jgi:hypothetical protein